MGGPPGRSGGTPQWGDAGAGRRLPIRGVARGASQWLSPESVLQTPQARPLSETRPLAEPRVPEPAVALRLSVTERTALAGALGGTLSPDGGISAGALGDQERGAPRFTACELSRVSHAARGRAHRPVRPGLSRDRTARGPPEKVPNRLQPWGRGSPEDFGFSSAFSATGVFLKSFILKCNYVQKRLAGSGFLRQVKRIKEKRNVRPQQRPPSTLSGVRFVRQREEAGRRAGSGCGVARQLPAEGGGSPCVPTQHRCPGRADAKRRAAGRRRKRPLKGHGL